MFKLSPRFHSQQDSSGDWEDASDDYCGMPYADMLATNLDTPVCRMEIAISRDIEHIPDGIEFVKIHPRCAVEIERMIEWAAFFASEGLAIDDIGGCAQYTLDAILQDETGAFNGPFMRVLSYFEGLEHLPDVHRTPWSGYFLKGLSAEDDALQATRGNLVAALGIAKLDRAVLQWELGEIVRATANMSMAWHCASVATSLNKSHLSDYYFVHRLPSIQATARARARHSQDPKQKAKLFAFECWKEWQKSPKKYLTATAFAKDMLDKKPNELTSDVVVARWARGWKKENR